MPSCRKLFLTILYVSYVELSSNTVASKKQKSKFHFRGLDLSLTVKYRYLRRFLLTKYAPGPK